MDNKVLKVMDLAIKFVDKLSNEEMEELVNGNYKFEITEKKKRNIISKKITSSKEDIDKIKNASNEIRKFESREEAAKFIENLNLTKDRLILLGKELGLRISKSYTKSKITDVIVEGIVGTKLKIEGLKKGIMGKHYPK